ncbi:uncharacterized protein LOC135205962 [Macrobrachium nipponense]|uniref:uncharacterized protein LOC135205962 n=1 Tax=Macrobrachium nipponense TaxID=159736 RepID=UPI0030C81FD4
MIEEEEAAPEPKPRSLTVKGLSEGFTHLERALASLFEAEDPNVSRFDKIKRGIMDLVTFYKETLKEKQTKRSVQSRLDTFFHKSPVPPPPTPSPEVVTVPDPPVLPVTVPDLPVLPVTVPDLPVLPVTVPDPPVPGPSVSARPPVRVQSDPFDSDSDPDDPEPFHGFDASPYTSDVDVPSSVDTSITSPEPKSVDTSSITSPIPSDSQAPAHPTP